MQSREIWKNILLPAVRQDGRNIEHLYVLASGLHGWELTEAASGRSEEVRFSLEDILSIAERKDARSFLIAHNHPGELAQPRFSPADIHTTRLLRDLARSRGITFIDHIVFTERAWLSFREENLFEAYSAKDGKLKRSNELIDIEKLLSE